MWNTDKKAESKSPIPEMCFMLTKEELYKNAKQRQKQTPFLRAW